MEGPRVPFTLVQPIDLTAGALVGEIERREPLADRRDLERIDSERLDVARLDVAHGATLNRSDIARLIDISQGLATGVHRCPRGLVDDRDAHRTQPAAQ